ncbi:MAG: TlpA family protein disulfide reductase [Magnetospirillum sp. WYHS-4]
MTELLIAPPGGRAAKGRPESLIRLLGIGASLAFALLLGACKQEGGHLKNGDAAPAFTATRLDGTPLRFPQDVAGKVVAVRFWADWCAFCREEMTAIEPIFLARKDQGLEVLAVNAGQSRDNVEKFAKKIGVSYPVLVDEGSGVARSYRVIGLPTTFLIGRDGAVKGRILGESDAAVLDRMLADLLQGG